MYIFIVHSTTTSLPPIFFLVSGLALAALQSELNKGRSAFRPYFPFDAPGRHSS